MFKYAQKYIFISLGILIIGLVIKHYNQLVVALVIYICLASSSLVTIGIILLAGWHINEMT